MSTKVLHIARGAGLAAGFIGAVAVSPAWASTCAPTVAPPTATIAVASDFFKAAKDLVIAFTQPGQPGAGKVIRICYDSTASLNTEIRSGNPKHFSLFLAEDLTTPVGLQGTAFIQSGAIAQLYAKGTPVLFARYATVPDVSTLLASQSGVSATINFNNLVSVPLDTTNAATVAVADPALTLYGDAAFKIMSSTPKGMNLFPYSTPGSEPNPLPSYLSSKYANIDLTFQSVASSPYPNKSGFVSKAQICSGIAPAIAPPANPTYTYVEFAGSKYVLLQAGIKIDSGNSTQNGIGSDLIDFMLNNSDVTFWPNFLSSHCYGQV